MRLTALTVENFRGYLEPTTMLVSESHGDYWTQRCRQEHVVGRP